MRKSRLALALLLTVLVGIVPAATSAQPEFRWGIETPLTAYPSQRFFTSCTPTTRVWSQELGTSGITRLRGRFEIRGPYDPGWLPTWWKSPWFRTGSFPNDARNFYAFFTLPFDYVTVGNGKQVAVWTVLIGEKPSFWARDAKIKEPLGTFICNFSPGEA